MKNLQEMKQPTKVWYYVSKSTRKFTCFVLIIMHLENTTLDEDECMLETFTCPFDATWNNIIASYKCTCNEEFIGSGLICESIVIR